MPLLYDYAEAERLLSPARLSSYRTSITPENDAQLFGSYSWNLAVVGAFYPLIQIIEVALRNAISIAAHNKIQCGPGQHWFDCILHTPDRIEGGNNVNAEQVTKFKTKIRSAKQAAKKSLRDKGHGDVEPTLDQIISQTDFSTWEYLFDKHFYNGSDNNFFWPHGLSKAFRKLPRTREKNPMFHQRDIIRRRIEEVRAFRNRISHNEPAWRVDDVKSREDVIVVLIDKLNNMMELLFWISPKFRNYVMDVGIESRLLQLLNMAELNRYMHTFEEYEITEIAMLTQLMEKANSDNLRCYFNTGEQKGILLPNNTPLLQ
ncbi:MULTISPECIES: hypothetical protein [unclassified Shewanella]|uniref:hypothetical protein n=1 Tax=unclassified Shewanella TaxID=196818 RepID=UPI000C49A6EA|nr:MULTISPECIES: hypothetical protein [unclassified Shewanella]PIP98561.1 MAG: hypothetical protein COW76_20365 [Shewanella sp. CG18_big_fil_WC_8_21_14_2_50_42_11]PIY64738.1 MAG: hypothetical protein COY92_15300 [Shewanella sp. CG_4_10_14_0_8_um_filter_42_13]